MRQGAIVLLVCFTVLMLVWLLALVGAISPGAAWSGWLPWGACLCLALAVFVVRDPRV